MIDTITDRFHCPTCGQRADCTALCPGIDQPANWAFWGYVSNPPADFELEPVRYGQLPSGNGTITKLPRAIRCRGESFVHFYVQTPGKRSHRIAWIR